MSLIKNVVLGADPEVFLFEPNTGKFISSIDKIGGNKHCPMELEEGFAVQEDNVLAEFNIPPAKTEEEFIFNLNKGFRLLKGILPFNLDLKIASSAFMPASEVEDLRAKQFGCDPDFNAWKKGEPNIKPACPDDLLLRTAGGHIHVGYDITDDEIEKADVSENIVRWMDVYLGIPSIIMDKDKQRRLLYGKAGAYRHKPYGVEYRTLSSFWLASDKLKSWAYRQTQRAIEKASDSKFVDARLSGLVVNTINNGNEDTARELVKELQLDLV